MSSIEHTSIDSLSENNAQLDSDKIYTELASVYSHLGRVSSYSGESIKEDDMPGSQVWLNRRKMFWRLQTTCKSLDSFLKLFEASYKKPPELVKCCNPFKNHAITPVVYASHRNDAGPYYYSCVGSEGKDYSQTQGDDKWHPDFVQYYYQLNDINSDKSSQSLSRKRRPSSLSNVFTSHSSQYMQAPQYSQSHQMTGPKSVHNVSIDANKNNSLTSTYSDVDMPVEHVMHLQAEHEKAKLERIRKLKRDREQQTPNTNVTKSIYTKRVDYSHMNSTLSVRESYLAKFASELQAEQDRKQAEYDQMLKEVEEASKQQQLLQNKYSYVAPNTSIQSWLKRIKPYFSDIRRKRKPNEYHINHEEHDTPYQDDADADIIEENNLINRGRSTLYNGSLHLSGFVSVAKMLDKLNTRMYLCVTGCDRYDRDSWLVSSGNPYYCYDDTPLPGWRKEIIIRMSGKTRGNTEIIYVSPSGKKLRSKHHLMEFMTQNNISHQLLPKFGNQSVYCVCHSKEDKSRSYIECSFGLAGCKQWLHPECVGLGYLKENMLRKLETVVCPLCAAYLEGTNELGTYSTGKRLLKKITVDMPNTITTVNGFTVEEMSRPHSIWGDETSLAHQFQDDTYFNMDIPSSDALEHHADATSPLDPTPRDEDSEGFNSGELRSSTKQKRKRRKFKLDESSLAGIFQHRLFQGLDDVSSASDSDTDSPLHYNNVRDDDSDDEGALCGIWLFGGDDDSESHSKRVRIPPQPVYSADVLAADRMRYARYPIGSNSFVSVKLEGACTKLKPREVVTSNDNDITNRVRIKREETLLRADETNTSMIVGHRYSRQIVQSNTSRVMPLRRQAFDLGYALLPLEDGGLRLASLQPSTSSELYSCKSVHQHCQDFTLCGLCLLAIDEQAKSLKSEKATKANVVKRKRSTTNGKRKKNVLMSKIIQDKIERLADEGDLDSDLEKELKENESAFENESAYEGVVECEFGVVKYPLHNACSSILHALGEILSCDGHSGITLDNGLYSYTSPEDAECDLCGRRGGVLQYFRIDLALSSIPPPSIEGWLGHLPCIHDLIKSNILFAPCIMERPSSSLRIWTSEYSNDKHVNALSMFDIVHGIAPCSLCGSCSGIVYRCCASGCTVYVHSLCATFAASQGWTTASLESHSKASKICFLCPVHS